MPDYYVATISMHVEISGTDLPKTLDLPCCSCIIRFTLNGIPEASFTIATGFKARDPSVLSNVHKYANNVGRQLSIQAYAIIQGDYGGGLKWPNREFLLFDGYITSVVEHSSGNASNIVIAATHWLSDLAASSAYTKWLHPSASDDLAVKAGVEMPQITMGMNQAPGEITYLGNSMIDVSAIDLKADLWTNVIKTLCLKFSHMHTMDLYHTIIDGNVTNQEACNNDSALRALYRMDNAKYIIPGVLSLAIPSDDIRRQVLDSIAMMFLRGHYGNTLWHKILTCASKFMFSIVPTVQTATCAPVIPFLRDIWAAIYPDEYESFRSQADMPELIRGMIGISDSIPFDDSRPVQLSKPVIYDLAQEGLDTFKNGSFMIMNLPGWCGGLIGPTINVAPRDANNPSKPETAYNALEKDLEYSFSRKFVKTALLYYIFRQRTGTIQGKLRFDIAPGSTVCIVGSGAAAPTLGSTHFYGLVTMVEVILDAQNLEQCNTSISVSNLHTLSEQRLQAFTIDKPPLYNDVWKGSPLINLPGLPGAIE